MSNSNNLYKFGWYSVDENDKRIIDNNELVNKRIEQHQAEEARRLAAENSEEGASGFSDGFEAGIGFDHIDAYDESQNIIGAPAPEDQFAQGDISDGMYYGEDPGAIYESTTPPEYMDNPDHGYTGDMNPEFAESDDGIYDGAEYSSEFPTDEEMQMAEGGMEPEAVPEPEPVPEVPQINLEEIQAQIDEQIRMAEEQAQQIVADAQAQADEIRRQAEEEGRNAGFNEGMARATEEVEQMKKVALDEITEEKARLQSDFQQLVNSIEPDMVDTLTQIYEHVFNVDLRDNKEIIMHLIRTTLGKMDSGTDIILHISADDYDLVSDEKASLEEAMTSSNSTLELVEDPLLKENECIIESEGGVFDCSLGVELSELSRKLKLLSFDRSRR